LMQRDTIYVDAYILPLHRKCIGKLKFET